MFTDSTTDVKQEPGVAQSSSAWFGESASSLGLFRVAYDTTPFEKRELEFYKHIVSGATAAGYQVTNSTDVDKVRRALAKNPQLKLLNAIAINAGKANLSHTSNVVDASAVFGSSKEVWLEYGKGISTSSMTSVYHRCFVEIDDRPKTKQADLVDHLHDGYGLPYPSDAVDSGTAYGFSLDDTDTTMVAGKSLHLGWNTTPATPEDWHYCQKGLITMFESDTACIAPSWRMRTGGVHAKCAGNQLMEQTRRQRWFWKDPHLDDELKELREAVKRWAGETGTDIPRRFVALRWLPKLKGCCTKLIRRADAAIAANSIYDANRINTTKAYVAKEMDRLSRGGMPDGNTEKLFQRAYDEGAEYDPNMNAKLVKPRKLVVPVNFMKADDAAAPDDGGRETGREPDGTDGCDNDQVNPGTGYLDAGWDLETEAFLYKDGSELVVGTFAELYEVYGNKQRTLLPNLMCRLCGKAGRETNASAAICYHPKTGSATFTCCACNQKQRSASTTGCKVKGSVVVKPLSYKEKGSHVHKEKSTPKTRYRSQLTQLIQAVGKKADIADLTDHQYIPDDFAVTRRQVFMALPQGKGKTEFIKKLAARNPDAKVLVVVPTMNLSDSAYGRLADYGFALYSEEKGTDLTHPRLVTCVDSVKRVMSDMEFDYVIIEETHSTLGRLNDKGMRNKNHVWCCLKRLCRAAGHVVAMDAGLTTADVHTVNRLVGSSNSQDMQLVHAKARRNKTAKLYTRLEDLLLEIPKEGGGPTLFYCTAKSDADTVITMLPQNARKLVVSSATSGEDEVIELMRNPNDLVSRYDYVLFTPSGNSGIDISVEHFEHVMVIARAGTFTDPWAVMQGTWRVRHCQDMHLWVQDANVGAHDDPAYYRDVIQKTADEEIRKATTESYDRSRQYEYVMFTPEPADPDFVESRIEMDCERARGQNNLRGYVVGMLKEQGVYLKKQGSAPRKMRKEVSEDYNERKTAVRAAENQAKANALPISIEEAGKLERKRRVTEEQRRQVFRAKMVETLGSSVDITADLVEEWERGDLKAKVHRYTGVEAYLAGDKGQYTYRRYRAYVDDPPRAESGNVLEASAMSRVLSEVYGVVSLRDLPETIDKPDDEHLDVLRALSNDPELRGSLAFHDNAQEKSLRFLQDLLRRVGISTKAEREQIDGVRRYYLEVDRKSVERMALLTQRQRAENEPLTDPEWVMDTSDLFRDDTIADTDLPPEMNPEQFGGFVALASMAREAEVARQASINKLTMFQQIGEWLTVGLH
jgi:hypothetical protein